MRHPKTLAERAWDRGVIQRPTGFIPNGCGPAATGPIDVVPDELLGAAFGGQCCNPHDLAYYEGGFWGLFWRKPRADVGLGACVAGEMLGAAKRNWRRGGSRKALAGAQAVAAVPVGTVYAVAVLALGWTPLTWRWRKRQLPKAGRLRTLAARAALPRVESTGADSLA